MSLMTWLLGAVAILIGLLCLLVLLIFLADINMTGWDLWPKIRRSRGKIKRLLAKDYPGVRVWSLGASSIDSKHFCVCIDVPTDAQRDRLQTDSEKDKQMRRLIADVGYPIGVIAELPFSIQSKETIDCDFAGSSWYARK